MAGKRKRKRQAKALESRYSIALQWSDEDQLYIASFPELGPNLHTHGETRQKALRNARKFLRGELLWYLDGDAARNGETLPMPGLFPGYDVRIALSPQDGYTSHVPALDPVNSPD